MMKYVVTVIILLLGAGLFLVSGYLYGTLKEKRKGEKEIANFKTKYYKFQCYYNVLNKLMIIKNKQISLEEHLIEMGLNSFAIYGWGELGKRFYEEIEHSRIKVDYIIDRNLVDLSLALPIWKPNADLPETKAIIVSAVYDFDIITMELREKTTIPILSLECVIADVFKEI